MTERGEFTGSDGLIDPAVWPYRAGALGLAWVEEVRAAAVRVARRTRDVSGEIQAAWQGLRAPGVYESPEAWTLYGALDPVVADGRREADILDWAADAVERYGDELASLELRLRNAESEANQFRGAILCGIAVPVEDLPFVRVPGLGSSSSFGTTTLGTTTAVGATFETLSWWEHRPSVERNRELVAHIAQVTEQVRQAEATLVKRLQQPGSGGGRGPRTPDRIDMFGPASSGPIVPDAGWFATASDKELLEWWRGLEPWEREAVQNAIAVMDVDAEAIGGRVADALREVADRSDGLDDVDTLDMLMQLFGEDVGVMGHALTVVGAAGLVAALNGVAGTNSHVELSPERRRQKLRIVDGLRASLTQVSLRWDQTPGGAEAAREFVRERDLEDVGWFLRPELGYLFADQYDNPMGLQLTLAMADRLDELERGELEGPAVYYEPPMSTLRELLTDDGRGEHSERINDPTGRVLGTLGQYPEAALAWLSVGDEDEFSEVVDGERATTGKARLDYFFGVRNSAPHDGFEGVAALWKGALQAEGGPQDPSSYDRENMSDDERAKVEQVWHDIAKVTTLAMRGLEGNPGFTAEGMSVLGSMELAAATTLALPHLVDTTVIEYAEGRVGSGDTAEGRSLPGVRGVYELPNVSRGAFERVYQVLTASPQGSGILADGARIYQDELLSAARAGAANPERLIARGIVLQGVIDGVEHGLEAGEARIRTEAAEEKIRTAIGLIPTPRIGDKFVETFGMKAIGGLGTKADQIAETIAQTTLNAAADKVVGTGKTAVEYGTLGSGLFDSELIEKYVPMIWTGHLEAAEARIAGDALDREAVLRESITMLADEFNTLPRINEDWQDLAPEERESRKIEYPEEILGHYNYVYDTNYHAADKSQDNK